MAEFVYRVHPAIGMARVGNSEEFYLAPETMAGLPIDGSDITGGLPIKPASGSEPETTIKSSDLRDREGAFKRQAARFKIFEYEKQGTESYPFGNGGEGTEIKIGDTAKVNGKVVKEIVWTVHVANKKANTFVTENPNLKAGELIIAGYENCNLPPIRNAPVLYGKQPTNPASVLSVLNDPKRVAMLTIDPGPRTISGSNSGKSKPGVSFDKITTASYWNGTEVKYLRAYPKSFPEDGFTNLYCPVGPIDTLGDLQTDGEGRLLVIGAYGRACAWRDAKGKPFPLDEYVDNDGWFDDTADGPVSAVLVFDDNSCQVVQGAWVVSTDPSYAPQILNVVSLWDDIYDTFVRKLDLDPHLFADGSFKSSFEPSFADHIQPIFRSAALQRWTTNLPERAIKAHDSVGNIKAMDDPGKTALGGLGIIRDPDNPDDLNEAFLMPLSLGDNGQRFLAPSLTQYFFLKQWDANNFCTGPGPKKKLGPGETLDKAVLGNCLGGRFSPGIDMTFIVRQPDLYIMDWQTTGGGPFRIKPKPLMYENAQSGEPLLTEGYVPCHTGNEGLEPGDTSKFMALPWHTDYNSCATHTTVPNPDSTNTLYWSWPAQRPVAVYPASLNASGDPTEQRWSVRGARTGKFDPAGEDSASQGRYQDSLNMVKAFHKIGVVIQGTAIDASDGGPFDKEYYLEVKSQLGDEEVTPFPNTAKS